MFLNCTKRFRHKKYKGILPLAYTRTKLIIFNSHFQTDSLHYSAEEYTSENLFDFFFHLLEMAFNKPSKVWEGQAYTFESYLERPVFIYTSVEGSKLKHPGVRFYIQ